MATGVGDKWPDANFNGGNRRLLQACYSPRVNIDPLTPTLFHEPWWLDAATQGRYSLAEVSRNGKIVARLPYFLQKRLGMSIVDLPPLTHFLGPAIINQPNTTFLQQLDIMKELISKLPPTSFFYIKCHRDVRDVVAFQCAGFRSCVQFTHEIPPEPESVLWKKVHRNARSIIRLAAECHNLSEGNDPAAFMGFYRQCKESTGKVNHLDIESCRKLIQACLERYRGRIYEARDQGGAVVAAIFCAWDHVTSYYLLTARHPSAHTGAISFLVWEAMIDAARRGLLFDCDGFDSEGGARFLSKFTSHVVPRFVAVRESATIRLFLMARSLLGKERDIFSN